MSNYQIWRQLLSGLGYYIRVGRLSLKKAFSGLSQFLETKTPLQIMKNAFYFTLKALFVLEDT